MPGRDGQPADMAILLDDLELDNIDQPNVVVEAVRQGIIGHLGRLERERPTMAPRTRAALSERASFHLAVPMIESWLFGDEGCLSRAGVLASRLPPRLYPGDPEALRTNDPDYMADDGQGCTQLIRRNRNKRRPVKAAWVRDDRERHPKAYLTWLCRDPAEKKCSTYRESDGGVDALRALNWMTALKEPKHLCYARALIQDISDLTGQTPEGVELNSISVPLTSRFSLPPDPVLRNI